MSWTVWLEIEVDTGGKAPVTLRVTDYENYTYNVMPMYAEALGIKTLRGVLSDRTAGDCLPMLERGVKFMEEHPERMRALNPENHWGNYEGALQFLRGIRDACAAHPKATVRVL